MLKSIFLFFLIFFSIFICATEPSLIESEEKVSIYPMPATTQFTVRVAESYNEGKIIITNVVGKEVKVIKLLNENEVSIQTKEFPKGIYFVTIQVNTDVVYTNRIVINK